MCQLWFFALSSWPRPGIWAHCYTKRKNSYAKSHETAPLTVVGAPTGRKGLNRAAVRIRVKNTQIGREVEYSSDAAFVLTDVLLYYTVHYRAACPQQCLYFLPEPQWQGSLRPIFRSAWRYAVLSAPSPAAIIRRCGAK
jgi:hypothetical protein